MEREPSRDTLLAMDYTDILRSEDPRIREAAKTHLHLNKVPILPEWNIKPHQIETLQWLYEREKTSFMGIRGGIVALDMGLGKSLTVTVHSLSRERGRYPTLLVCSKTLLSSWRGDLTKFFGKAWVDEKVIFLHRDYCKLDSVTLAACREAELVITAYPSCASAWSAVQHRKTTKEPSSHKGLDVLYDIEWTRVVLDESQTICNPDTNNYKAVTVLRAACKVCLTGTPLRNYDEDLLSQLVFLGITPVPYKKAWNASRFKDMGLDCVVLSMSYEYAGITLPNKDDFHVLVKMSPEEEKWYTFVKTKAVDVYNEMDKRIAGIGYANVLAMITMLRQSCLAPYLISQSDKNSAVLEDMKDSELVQWLTNKEGTAGMQSAKSRAVLATLEGLANKRVVVFSMFSSYLHLLEELLQRLGRPCLLFDGSLKSKDREEVVRRFNEEDKPWVLLINYKIGSEGLNLQICNEAIFLEPWWTPTAEKQAVRRVWRCGQENEVHCYFILVGSSIEERMIELCDKKTAICNEYAGKPVTKRDEAETGYLLGVRDLSGRRI
jgi:SNF2 family DNA or RNA helicase